MTPTNRCTKARERLNPFSSQRAANKIRPINHRLCFNVKSEILPDNQSCTLKGFLIRRNAKSVLKHHRRRRWGIDSRTKQ